MKAVQTRTVAAPAQKNTPFFRKESGQNFFHSSINEQPFFSKTQNHPAGIQTKLAIGQPGDIYEKEADAVADKVVQRLAEPASIQAKPFSPIGSVTSFVQKKCAHCEEEGKLQKKEEEDESGLLKGKLQKKPIFESNTEPPDDEKNIQRKCAECAKEDEKKLQRKCDQCEKQREKLQKKPDLSYHQTTSSDIESRLHSSKGAGAPLPTATRAEMENSFGSDFSNVRIHNDSAAVQMSRDLNAQAFTHGSDVYFNSGKYDANSIGGKHLLAHELTHVVQQGAITPGIQRLPSWDEIKEGAGEIYDSASQTVNDTIGNVADSATQTVNDVADAVTGAASGAVDWLKTQAGKAALYLANKIIARYGGKLTYVGGTIILEIEDISLFSNFQKELGDDELPAIPILHIPLFAGEFGPVVVEAGLEVNLTESILAALGPGEIRNIQLRYNLTSGDFEGHAQLYVAAALGERLSIFGGIVGRVLGVIPMDPPIPIEGSLEGGVRGTGTAWGLGAVSSDMDLAYRGGTWSFDADNDIMIGLLLQGDVDLYAAAKLFERLVCEYAYPVKHWEAGEAYKINIPVSLAGGAPPAIGTVTHGPMPIEEIETAIEPLSYGLNCKALQEIIEELCKDGLLPKETCEQLKEIIEKVNEAGDKLGEGLGITASTDMQCGELPDFYRYKSYKSAESELRARLGIPASTPLFRKQKRATEGPCPRVGWHYNVWDNSGFKGAPLGTIVSCPCKIVDPTGREITVERFAVVKPFNTDFTDVLDFDYDEYLQDVSPTPLALPAGTIPTVTFTTGSFPNIAPHIKNAQSTLGKPKQLSRLTDQQKIRANRRAACGSFPGPGSCDEYPFASTHEGGTGAAVKGVPLREQNQQGGFLGGFYRRFKLGDKDKFKVKAT